MLLTLITNDMIIFCVDDTNTKIGFGLFFPAASGVCVAHVGEVVSPGEYASSGGYPF